ncbi:MAG: succinate dehydrogenase cytochrome b subunit [Bdellovibrio sp.]|nr:succinate dehydrogenase cytochrome b subunit [Bdellovibrio sp.]
MSYLLKYVKTSIVKKQLMAASGLLLCGFLLTHMAGNFLIYFGPEFFNTYSHKLISNPFIYIAEAILVLIFLSHICLAIKVTLENRAARPEPYYVSVHSGRGATLSSSTMPITGFIILTFLIWHVVSLKYGPHYEATYNGVVMRDLHKLVIEYFQIEWHVGLYILAMAAAGMHAFHGFWSAFQSLGVNHPKYNCCIRFVSKAFGVFVALGYSAFPIYCYLQGGN